MAIHHILVTDEVDPEGIALLTAERSFTVDVVPTLPAAALLERIGNYDALTGRSATKVTAELPERGTRLRGIGRAGGGVGNSAMEAATRLPTAVLKPPAG